MAKTEDDRPLIPSVLDRLLDDNPGAAVEPPVPRSQSLRDIKQGVRRDLENLLNTRRRCLSYPEHLDELMVSLVNYGIPEVVGAGTGKEEDREAFRRGIEDILNRYEPRLQNVKVTRLGNADDLDRTMHFRIEAVLRNPIAESILFDTALEPTTGDFEVRRVL